MPVVPALRSSYIQSSCFVGIELDLLVFMLTVLTDGYVNDGFILIELLVATVGVAAGFFIFRSPMRLLLLQFDLRSNSQCHQISKLPGDHPMGWA